MSERPIWRWWLFCAALSLFWRTQWRWAGNVMGWSVKTEWLGEGRDGEGVPF